MSGVPALSQQPTAQILPQPEQKPAKPGRVSRRLAAAIRLMITGECRTQKAAADSVGMNYSHFCEALKKPHVAAYLEQQTRVALAQSQAPAAATLLRLLDQANSEHVQKDVAIHLLNIAGHKPASDAQVSVNVNIKAGFVIDLTDEPKRQVVDVSAARLAHD